MDFSWVFDVIPAKYAFWVALAGTSAVTISNYLLQKYPPPSSSSKWWIMLLYKLMRAIAFSKGWNAPAFQPDMKAIMVPKDASRTAIAQKLGVHPESTDPRLSGKIDPNLMP